MGGSVGRTVGELDGVADGVEVGVAVDVEVGVGVGVNVGVGVGVGVASRPDRVPAEAIHMPLAGWNCWYRADSGWKQTQVWPAGMGIVLV